MRLMILPTGRIAAVSFVEGTRIYEPRPRQTDDDILARALWLSNHGALDKAEDFLEMALRNSPRH